MPSLLQCPACGGALSLDVNGQPAKQCPYCGVSLSQPEAAPAALGGPTDLSQLARLAEVMQLARAGHKLEAIKLYRQIMGADLAEAKRAVEAMQGGQLVTISGGRVRAGVGAAPEKAAAVRQILALAQAGQVEEAVQAFQAHFGVGADEARAAVQAMLAARAGQAEQAAATGFTPEQSARLGEIRALVDSDQKLAAIKLFRETFDCSLSAAKAAVEAIARGDSPELAVERARRPANTGLLRPGAARSTGRGLGWLAFGALGLYGLLLAFSLLFRLSGSYRQALDAANADARITAALGAPVRDRWWLPIFGQIKCGGGCRADYAIPVAGPRQTGQLEVRSHSAAGGFLGLGGEWDLNAQVRLAATEQAQAQALAEAHASATQAAQAAAATQAAAEAAQATATAEAQATAQASATAAAILAAAPNWPAIISETFQNNQLNWPVGLTRDNSLSVDAAVSNGHYAWTVNVKRGNSYFNLIPNGGPALDSFSVAVDLKWIQPGDGQSAYGLVFRQVNDDYGFCGLQSNGQYRLLTVFGSGVYQSVLSSSDLIHTGPGAVNHLAVSGVGSDFVCAINGQVVEIFHEDFVPGAVGLGIDALASGAQERVEFDNFVAQTP